MEIAIISFFLISFTWENFSVYDHRPLSGMPINNKQQKELFPAQKYHPKAIGLIKSKSTVSSPMKPIKRASP
jgi:hypothetical protein